MVWMLCYNILFLNVVYLNYSPTKINIKEEFFYPFRNFLFFLGMRNFDNYIELCFI